MCFLFSAFFFFFLFTNKCLPLLFLFSFMKTYIWYKITYLQDRLPWLRWLLEPIRDWAYNEELYDL